MVRKLTAWVVVGAMGLGAVDDVVAGMPAPARADNRQLEKAAAKKRVPASRLVRPKNVAQLDQSPVRESPPVVDPPPTEVLPDEPLPLESVPETDEAPTESLPEPVKTNRAVPEDTGPIETAPSEIAPAEPVSPAPTPASSGEVFRLEPPNKLVPVGKDELKPGVIYLHHSPSLGRQVWSFLQANGEFWHAFGPGTTQTVDHFDFRMTDEERTEALTKIDPKLAFDVSSTGAKVFLRLETDNTWKLVRTNSVPSIYDLETSQRWEKQWDRYLPVVHICGDTWEHRDGGYQAPHWGPWMRPN
jgi:hypothetical protein